MAQFDFRVKTLIEETEDENLSKTRYDRYLQWKNKPVYLISELDYCTKITYINEEYGKDGLFVFQEKYKKLDKKLTMFIIGGIWQNYDDQINHTFYVSIVMRFYDPKILLLCKVSEPFGIYKAEEAIEQITQVYNDDT